MHHSVSFSTFALDISLLLMQNHVQMKKQLLTVLVCLMALGGAQICANVQKSVVLEYGKIDGSPTHQGAPKSPV